MRLKLVTGVTGGHCLIFFLNWIITLYIIYIYIIDWEYIAVSNQQYDTRFGSWWRWATSKQVSKNGCMLIPSGVGAMWLANNSNIYM